MIPTIAVIPMIGVIALRGCHRYPTAARRALCRRLEYKTDHPARPSLVAEFTADNDMSFFSVFFCYRGTCSLVTRCRVDCKRNSLVVALGASLAGRGREASLTPNFTPGTN